MGAFTRFFDLFKPAKTDRVKVSDLNPNWDTIDTEMHRPPLTVNGIAPNPVTRDLYVETVPLAENLASDVAQLVSGTFIERTSGGEASIEDGTASITSIKGNMVRTGYVAESLNMTVTPAERSEGVDPITATIDRDTFVAAVSESGTTTLTYTTDWSADPATYGITVTGTPISGDVITVVYVKEDRGTITVASPTSFNSTGWNLYNNTDGYARVVKYSDDYGYKLGGTYSLVQFSETYSGTKSALTITDGYFNVPSDGYVWITGGDSTTYIYATWSDLTDDYEGEFQGYTVDTIDLTEVMLIFPYGLMAVGNVRDEINMNAQQAINRIERMTYSAENLADVIASGVDYIYDTNYIYAVRETAATTSIEIDPTYTVSDHGIEFFDGTTIPVLMESLYGENLKDKLRTDVLTISGGLVNNLTSTATDKALTAAQGKALNDQIGTLQTTSIEIVVAQKLWIERIGKVRVLLASYVDPSSIAGITLSNTDLVGYEVDIPCTVEVPITGGNGVCAGLITIGATGTINVWYAASYKASWTKISEQTSGYFVRASGAWIAG
jgi:hypothetical protein